MARPVIYDSFQFQSQPWGKTVLRRVYCQLNLNLPRRSKKRLPARIKQPLVAGGTPNDTWSCDFMADALWNGRRSRTFNVLDEFNREALRIEINTSLPAGRVVRALNELTELRGKLQRIRLDNGPELVGQSLENGVELMFTQPGKPTQNAYIERFNRSYRTEVLDCYVFESLHEVRRLTEDWLYRSLHKRAPWKTREAVELATLEWVSWFNNHRLLESIGYITPVEAEVNYYRQLAKEATTVA